MKKRNLHTAKVSKKDKFYTQLSDIEREFTYNYLELYSQQRGNNKG